MAEAETTPKVVVRDTNKGFDYWLAKEYLTDATRNDLRKCSVLLVPHEGWQNHTGPVFADRTQQLLEHLKAELPPGIVADVCIEEDDYHEIALYSDWLRLGEVLVTLVAVPTVVGVLVAWITTKAIKPGVGVSISLSVEHDEDGRKKVTSVTYQGPVEKMKEHLNSTLREIRERPGSGIDPDYPAEPKE